MILILPSGVGVCGAELLSTRCCSAGPELRTHGREENCQAPAGAYKDLPPFLPSIFSSGVSSWEKSCKRTSMCNMFC